MEAPPDRILIVDDEENLLPLFKKILQKEGYEVECASSAEIALIKLRSQCFDLVISDLHMSGMTGLDLLKEAKAVNPALPFIMLTAFGTLGVGAAAVKNGAHDYLVKPVHNEELKSAVKKALGLRQSIGAQSRHERGARTTAPSLFFFGSVTQPVRQLATAIKRFVSLVSKTLHCRL